MPLTLDHRPRQRRQGRRRLRRACAPRSPRGAAARRADGRRRRALPARAGRRRPRLRRRGADLRAAGARDRGRARACAGARSGASRATGSCGPSIADARLSRARGIGGGARASRAAAGGLFAELQRTLVTPGAASPRRCALGRRERPRARYAQRARRRCTRPTAGGWRRSGASTPRATRGRRSTRCAPRPASWSGRAVFLYGFDDLTPRAARRGRDARGPRRRRGVRRAAVRAGPCGVRRPGGDRRAAAAARRASTCALPDRSEHYAPSARAARCTTSSAGCSRRTRSGAAAERRGAAARGGRRARRGRARRRRGARADARGHARRRTSRCSCAAPPRGALLAAGARRLRHPRRATSAARRSRARGSAPACSACARAALPGGSARRTSLTWLRTPGRLAGSRRPPTRSRRAVRRRGVESARTARASGSASWAASRWASLDDLAAAAAPAACAQEGAAAFLAALGAQAARRSGPRRTAAAPRCSTRTRRRTRAWRATCACARAPSCAALDPQLARRSRRRCSRRSRAVRVRERLGTPGRRRARRPAGDPRAALPRGVRVRAAGRRVPAPPGARAVPRRRRPRARSARASGLVLPLHEDVLARERYLFYACVSRPEEVLLLSWRSSDEEGEPQPPRRSSTTCARCSPTSCGRLRGRAAAGRGHVAAATHAPTPLELRRAHAAGAGAARPRAARRAPDARAVLAVLAAARDASARAAWRRSRRAACAGWSSACCARSALEPDPEPMRRGSLAHAVLERTLRRLRERTGSARLTAGDAAPPRSRRCDAALARASAGSRPAPARERALRGAGGRPAALPARRGRARRRARGRRLEWRFGREGDAHAAARARGAGLGVSGRVDRIDVGARRAQAIVRDYKGRTVHPAARLGGRPAACRSRSTLLAARELLGLRPGGAALPAARAAASSSRAGSCATGLPGPRTRTDIVEAGGLRGGARAGARDARPRRRGALRPGGSRPCPERCATRRLRVPAICRAAS